LTYKRLYIESNPEERRSKGIVRVCCSHRAIVDDLTHQLIDYITSCRVLVVDG
jgi:hypothetical protein